jgi:hypothetical protein
MTVQYVERVGGRTLSQILMRMMSLVKVVELRRRSALLAKFLGIFHLVLDYKDFIC